MGKKRINSIKNFPNLDQKYQSSVFLIPVISKIIMMNIGKSQLSVIILTHSFRARILHLCLNHLTDFLNIYQSLSAIVEIAQPFKSLLVKVADTSKCQQISVRFSSEKKNFFF
jgi:hypothetical protein